ncbi:hypothetical protein ACI2VK_15070 [Ralstonia nicotianae]|nr:hypothetical protein [Ralstonia solanacearum]
MLVRKVGQWVKAFLLLCLAQPSFGGPPVPISLVRIADNSTCHRGDQAMEFRDFRSADQGTAFQVPKNHALLVTDLIVSIHAQSQAANSVVHFGFGAQTPTDGVDTEQLAINVPVDAAGHGGANVHLSTGIPLLPGEQLCAWWTAAPGAGASQTGTSKPILVTPIIHVIGVLQPVIGAVVRKYD